MSSSNTNEKNKLNANYGKCVMASMYGEMLNDSSNFSEHMNFPILNKDFCYADTDSLEISVKEIPEGWGLVSLDYTTEWGEVQRLIDDGLANGFEFRLQGSTLLFREVQS